MADEVKKADEPGKAKATEVPTANATGAVEAPTEAGAAPKKKKKGKKRSLQVANVTIKAGYNNTIISITEPNGNVVCWASAGSCGFKGTRKATPYAASIAADTAINKAKNLGVERVHISVKGVGTGRDQALRAIAATGVSIESLSDRTTVAHGGCRPKKARRI